MDIQTIINEKISQVGDEKEQPPIPIGGIPKQKIPFWIRWFLRILLLPFIWIDQAAQKIAKWIIRPPFVRLGACRKRGNCCHYILHFYPKSWIGKIVLFWNLQVNGFYLRFTEPFTHEGKQMLVLGCRFLKKEGTCGQHFLRPAICRQWPRVEQFGYPQILKGCGYRVFTRDPRFQHLGSDPSNRLKVLGETSSQTKDV